MDQVPVISRSLGPLADLIGEPRTQMLTTAARDLAVRLNGRTIWQVNSTSSGGGVAELLHALLGYPPDLGTSSPWLVMRGDAQFFELTKRLHNRIHGSASGKPFDASDDAHYRDVSQANAKRLIARVRPGDVVVLHDPQTAGMVPALAAYGVVTVWRCHIGTPKPSEVADGAWHFLRPYIAPARAHVFSRSQYRPDFVRADITWVIQPSIDPFAPKNAHLDPDEVIGILRSAGILAGTPGDEPASVVAEVLPDASTPLVTQISRWDRLKDMRGVMRAFADHVVDGTDAYLVLAGPQTDGVSDDPEGAEVYADCVAAWQELPAYARRRVMLASLPMTDPEANARMVNALQRHSTVVTQKSLAEGFGLTVAEAMWKSRPVVGGAVGGIVDQIGPGRGVLVDPNDLAEFGAAVRGLLEDPEHARKLGEAAHVHVRERFLPDIHLLRWVQLLTALIR